MKTIITKYLSILFIASLCVINSSAQAPYKVTIRVQGYYCSSGSYNRVYTFYDGDELIGTQTSAWEAPASLTYYCGSVPSEITVIETMDNGNSETLTIGRSSFGQGGSAGTSEIGSCGYVNVSYQLLTSIASTVDRISCDDILNLELENFLSSIPTTIQVRPVGGAIQSTGKSSSDILSLSIADFSSPGLLRNCELQIRVKQPNMLNYTEWEGGFYFLTPPRILTTGSHQPTCYDSNDASLFVLINNATNSNQLQINVSRYTTDDNMSTPEKWPDDPNNLDYYKQDAITTIVEITPGGNNGITINNDFVSACQDLDSSVPQLTLTSGLFKIELSINDDSNAGLCTIERWIMITPPTAVVLASASVYDVIDQGLNGLLPQTSYQATSTSATGSANLSVTGGTGSYEYQLDNSGTWTTLASNHVITGLSASVAGTSHTVKVRDTNECEASSSKSVSLKCPDDITISVTTEPTNLCGSTERTSIKFNVAGGAGPFSAVLTKGGQTFGSKTINTRNNYEFLGLSSGDYVLTVTDQASGRTSFFDTHSFSIAKNNIPSVSASSTPISSCDDLASDGTITLTASNGSGNTYNYYYKLSTSETYTSCTNSITGKSAGTYNVQVENNGCYSPAASVTIDRRSIPEITSSNPTDQVCNSQGSITLSVSGINSGENYILHILNSSKTSIGNEEFTAASANESQTISTLDGAIASPVNYYGKIEIVGASGCVATTDNYFSISYNNPLDQLSIDQTSITDEACSGKADAQLQILNTNLIESNYTFSGGGQFEKSTGVVSGLSAGNYDFTIEETTTRGCTATLPTTTINLSSNTLKVSDSPLEASCAIGIDGAITLTASDGFNSNKSGQTTTYTFFQDNIEVYSGNTTNYKFEGLTGNQEYTFKVIDDYGCSIEIDQTPGFSLTNPILISDPTITNDHYCIGGLKGNFDISAETNTGGSMEFVLNDPSGQSASGITNNETVPFNNLSASTYTLTVTDNKSTCTNTKEVTIDNLNLQPIVGTSINDPLACSSADNGSITIDITQYEDFGGTTFPTFELKGADNSIISPSSTSELIKNYSDLDNQNYTITVTDQYGCSYQNTFNVPVSTNTVALGTPTILAPHCYAAANGNISITAEKGKPFDGDKYTFQLLDIEENVVKETTLVDNAFFDGLYQGDYYKLKVIDNVDCFDVSEAFPIPERPDSLMITGINDKTNPNCKATATGSFQPQVNQLFDDVTYTYKLLIDETENEGEYDSAMVFKDLLAGTYTVTIKGDDNCAADYAGIMLTDPSAVQIYDEWNNYIRAKGASTGVYKVNIADGNKKFDYQWWDSNNSLVEEGQLSYSEDDGQYEANLNINNQPAGTYTIMIRDTAGCAYFDNNEWYTNTVQLLEPDKALGFAAINLTDITCNKLENGSIEVQAAGGWGDTDEYRYSLDTIQSGWQVDQPLFDNLRAGIYDVFLKDTADVVFQTQVELTQPDTLNILIQDTFNASCPNYADGWVKATVLKDADYNENLQYFITNESGTVITDQTKTETAFYFNQLLRGNYSISIEDSNQCKASKTFSIGEPDTAQIALDYNYIRQKGDATGYINALIEKGNGQFDYEWYLENQTTPFTSGSTNNSTDVKDLIAGNYKLMVRDTAGCVYEGDEWMERHIEILEPELAMGMDTMDWVMPYCYGLSNGHIQLQGTGGWGDYTYVLNNESNQTGLFENLAAGTYPIVIRDSVDVEYIHNLVITQPDVLTASLSDYKDVRCYGYSDGYINLDINGGNLQYEVSTDQNNWFANDSVPDLAEGTYTVYVRDTLNCETNVPDITLVQPSELIQTQKTITLSRCSNNEGAIISAYQGGVEPYTYSWQKDTLLSDNSIDTISLDYTTPSIDNLYSSRYFLEVRDDHDCPYEFAFSVGDITNLSIDTIEVTDVSCYGYADGVALATVSLGNPDYIYSWASTIPNHDLAKAWGMPTGTYDLLVRDSKGCAVFKEFTVGTPDSLAYSINSIIDPLCLGGLDGELDLSAIGGTAPYSYLWDDGTTSSTIDGIEPGVRSLQVTDNHNCVNQFDFEFNYQRIIQPFIGNDTLICHYNSLPVNAGTYDKFQWTANNNFSSKNQIVNLTDPGTYYLEVTDEDNCIGFDTLNVEVSYLDIASLNTVDVTCNGMADGSAIVGISPADWSHTIEWPDNSSANEWEELSGGDYAVRVFDEYGCGDTVQFSIYEPNPLTITNNLIMNPYCFGVPDGKIEVATSGGRTPYTLSWEHGSQSTNLAKLDTGRYVLEVWDAMNCYTSEEYIMNYEKTIYPQLGDDQALCFGNNIRLYPGLFEQYDWKSTNGITSNDTSIIVTDAGTYYVEVENYESCIGRDTVQIELTESSLTPEFLMASSVPLGDTLMIIEVSQPKPSVFDWTISGPHRIVETNDHYCKVIFEEEGTWEVALNAYTDKCMGQNIKSVLVTQAIDRSELDEEEASNSNLLSLILSPNPTDGPFNATLTLNEAADVTFYVVSIDNGQIIEKRKVNGLDYYEQSFSLSSSGLYAIFAESEGERIVRKLVVY